MFCGFNDKMLRGLTEFNEGLVEHGLMHNAEKNKESIDQAIRREISDMTRLITETHRIHDAPKRLMTEALVKYVMAFYMHMRKKNVVNYKEVIQKVGEYFTKMDDKYYSEFDGKPEDMKEIAEFLDEIKI